MKNSLTQSLFCLVLLVTFFVACEEDDGSNEEVNKNFCNTIVEAEDTLEVGIYKFFFNTSINDSLSVGLIEFVDFNKNRIDTLNNLTIRQIKVKGSGNCYETKEFDSSFVGSDGITLGYSNVPMWASDTLNQSIIQIDFDGINYYLEDPSVNN